MGGGGPELVEDSVHCQYIMIVYLLKRVGTVQICNLAVL